MIAIVIILEDLSGDNILLLYLEYREDAVEDSKSSPTKEKINCFTCFER